MMTDGGRDSFNQLYCRRVRGEGRAYLLQHKTKNAYRKMENVRKSESAKTRSPSSMASVPNQYTYTYSTHTHPHTNTNTHTHTHTHTHCTCTCAHIHSKFISEEVYYQFSSHGHNLIAFAKSPNAHKLPTHSTHPQAIHQTVVTPPGHPSDCGRCSEVTLFLFKTLHTSINNIHAHTCTQLS